MKKAKKAKIYYQLMNDDVLNLYFYSEITNYAFDEKDITAEKLAEKLSEFKGNNINIFVNSIGGEVYETYAIASQLLRAKANKTCYIDGIAASAATLIPMACDKVIMASYATMFIHNAWVYVSGNSNDLRKAADDLDKLMETNKSLYMRKFAGTIEELTEMLDAETTLTAKECKEFGFCDEIVEEIETPEEPDTNEGEPDKDENDEDETNTGTYEQLVKEVTARVMQKISGDKGHKKEDPQESFKDKFLKVKLEN